jgi:hypothetical protein
MAIVLDGTAGMTLPGSNTSAQLGSLTLGSSVTASGSNVDFTSIPSWVKRITVNLNGISAAATGGSYFVRIGSGGSAVSSGYNGISAGISGATTSTGTQTAGFYAGSPGNAATVLMYSTVVLVLQDASTNTWVASMTGYRDDSTDVFHSSYGIVSLSGVLDTVSVVLSSSTFDAGTVNIMYE